MKVVIADGDVERLKVTQALMSSLRHHTVAIAADGVWAVSMCRKHAPDLAILDGSLAEMSTSQVVDTLRRENLARFILVGYDDLKNEMIRMDREARSIGLRRPFSSDNLLVAIKIMEDAAKAKLT